MKSNYSAAPVIDKRVVQIIMVSIGIALAALAFRYQNYKAYDPVAIHIYGDSLHAGKIVRFGVKPKAGQNKKLVWDFGDKSTKVEDQAMVSHVYAAPGLYSVRLTVDGLYVVDTVIKIEQRMAEDNAIQKAVIAGPTRTKVGKPEVFKDATPNANKWEWWFGENILVDATAQQVTHTFNNPGMKKVILIVNGNIQGELAVLVDPAPEIVTGNGYGSMKKDNEPRDNKNTSIPGNRRNTIEDAPLTPPIATQINTGKEDIKPVPLPPVSPPEMARDSLKKDNVRAEADKKEEFRKMLYGVVDGNNIVPDFKPYLCNLEIPVTYNGMKMNFKSFCMELKKIKKSAKISSLNVAHESEANAHCTSKLTVKIKLKNWGFVF